MSKIWSTRSVRKNNISQPSHPVIITFPVPFEGSTHPILQFWREFYVKSFTILANLHPGHGVAVGMAHEPPRRVEIICLDFFEKAPDEQDS
jgi:hypothetical protein